MKKMLFVTTSYPFGEREASFVRPEIAKLSEKFDITLVSRNSVDEQTSQVPENVKVFRYNSKKSYNVVKYLLKTIFSPYIYGEIITLIKKKKVSIAKIKKAIKYCMRSNHFADYLKSLRKEMGDEVVLYTYWNDYSVMSLSLIKQPKDKLVSRAHGTDLYERRDNNYYLPLKEISNRKTDLIAFISNQGKDYFSRNFKTDSKKEIFYLGVKKQEKKAIDKKEKELYIYSFSYVLPVKRIDRIIDSLQRIPEDFHVNWIHIGAGILYEEMVKNANEKLGNKNNITYTFTGAMENRIALEYISEQDFDLLINTSESEGLPMTMMEAMSFGIPVLALDIGGVSEIVENGKNGYLLPADADADLIAKALITHINNINQNKTDMQKNAYNSWEKHFNEENNYKNFTDRLYSL